MSQPSWIGTTIGGRYEILELVGQGGYSAVYKANDPNLRRVVAIKLIHAHLSSNPQFVHRFEEEAAAVASLRHPNIVQVHDFSHDGDAFYIVFEFVPGESLQAHLQRIHDDDRLMPYSQIVEIAVNVADALGYAHDRGFIHRDIKPANVMLNVHGQAILMDFGVLKIVGGDSHTATGAMIGTALYMSPEQIRSETADARSDIYSFGVMLYEMVGAQPPFEADSAMSTMMMHVNNPVPDLWTIRPDVPGDLISIINKALAKDPVNRFQTAAEMIAALREANLEPPADMGTVIMAPAFVESEGQQSSDTVKIDAETGPQAKTQPKSSRLPGSNRAKVAIFGGIVALILLFLCIVAVALSLAGVLPGVGSETSSAETAIAVAVDAEIEEPTKSPAVEDGGISNASDSQPENKDAVPTATIEVKPTSTSAGITPSPLSPTPIPLPSSEGMINITGGLYEVGGPLADDFHLAPTEITLDEFWIDQFEVPNILFMVFVDQTGHPAPESWPGGSLPPNKENHPVKGVTWDEADAYCDWLNKRLPSEAEWEVAARGPGPNAPLYPWGANSEAGGQAGEMPLVDTYEAGSFPFNQSPFEVYDMAGNVWEWVDTPYGPVEDSQKLLRGGRHGLLKDMAYRQQAAADSERLVPFAGFRCATNLVEG